LSDVLMIS